MSQSVVSICCGGLLIGDGAILAVDLAGSHRLEKSRLAENDLIFLGYSDGVDVRVFVFQLAGISKISPSIVGNGGRFPISFGVSLKQLTVRVVIVMQPAHGVGRGAVALLSLRNGGGEGLPGL